MLDGKGRRLGLGDFVEVWPGAIGEIVCSFDDRQFGPGFTRAEWKHLKTGALIRLENGELIHYEKPDEDLKKIRAIASRPLTHG